MTIPADVACENCILQWFWDGDQNYYNCADITVTAAAGEAGALLSPNLLGGENLNEYVFVWGRSSCSDRAGLMTARVCDVSRSACTISTIALVVMS